MIKKDKNKKKKFPNTNPLNYPHPDLNATYHKLPLTENPTSKYQFIKYLISIKRQNFPIFLKNSVTSSNETEEKKVLLNNIENLYYLIQLKD